MREDAQANHKSSWARHTATEIKEIGAESGSVLVVPIGSMEQHGDHLPVATDTILVSEVAAIGVERTEDEIPLLVLPPLWSGFSPHHLSFGGTISLEFEHMLHVLEDIARTGLKNDFDAILLLNGHGGNIPLMNGAVSTIGAEHPDVEVLGLTYFQLASVFIDEIRDSPPGGMGHGGEFETSLMLYLYPDLVREDEIEGTMMDEPYEQGINDMFAGGPLAVYRGFEEYTTTGAIGSPEQSSADKGKQIYERLGDGLEAVLRGIYVRNKS